MEKPCVHKDICWKPTLPEDATNVCSLAPFIVLNSGCAGTSGQVNQKKQSMDVCIKTVHFYSEKFYV